MLQLYDSLEDYMDYEVDWDRHAAMCLSHSCAHLLELYQDDEYLADVSSMHLVLFNDVLRTIY